MGARVVIDTNVVVSAFGWSRDLRLLFRLIQQRKVTLLLSQPVFDEYSRVLAYSRFGFDEEERRKLLDFFLHWGLFVEPTVHLSIVTQDPSDDRFLELCEAADVDALITGDRHLLALGRHGRTRILTPRSFMEERKGV